MSPTCTITGPVATGSSGGRKGGGGEYGDDAEGGGGAEEGSGIEGGGAEKGAEGDSVFQGSLGVKSGVEDTAKP
jgi:hypothetical protein